MTLKEPILNKETLVSTLTKVEVAAVSSDLIGNAFATYEASPPATKNQKKRHRFRDDIEARMRRIDESQKATFIFEACTGPIWWKPSEGESQRKETSPGERDVTFSIELKESFWVDVNVGKTTCESDRSYNSKTS